MATSLQGQDTQERVRWTDEERRALISQTFNILNKNPGKSLLDALRGAQESGLAIKPDRIRDITTLSQVPWLEEGIKQKKQEMPVEVDTKIIESVIVAPMNLQEVSTDALLQELMFRMFSNGGQAIVDRAVSQIACELRKTLERRINKIEQVDTTPTKLRRVLIIGLLPNQGHEIDTEFRGLLEISHWTDGENLDALRARAKSHDTIIIMKKFVDKTAQDIVKSAGMSYILIPGGISELKEYITQKLVLS